MGIGVKVPGYDLSVKDHDVHHAEHFQHGVSVILHQSQLQVQFLSWSDIGAISVFLVASL
ncbi:hypothetical protein LCGC14_1334060 [marine sediment metagenome]|uniref:Uncharacterized protein n=1 Tax=marine sediment metagenome TaxID=412755 RepID=A0A0F9MWJ2_9ZZZZ